MLWDRALSGVHCRFRGGVWGHGRFSFNVSLLIRVCLHVVLLVVVVYHVLMLIREHRQKMWTLTIVDRHATQRPVDA
jgi:hypothetical protein